MNSSSFQGNAFVGARARHGREEPVGRGRHHQDPVPARQQPHHPRRRHPDGIGIRVGIARIESREIGDEQRKFGFSVESRQSPSLKKKLLKKTKTELN